MYYTYVIYSRSTDKFYKGQTYNLNERLKRHNSGKEKFTSKGIPWILVWFVEKKNRGQALVLEKKLKNMSRDKLVRFMRKYKDHCAGPDTLILLDQGSGC